MDNGETHPEQVTLPVSVVVPHVERRRDFLRDQVLPALHRNHPAEVLVIEEGKGPGEKRNLGAARASQPYIFFCDDDVVIREGSLRLLFAALERDPGAAFAYTDCQHVVHEGVEFRQKSALRISGEFDPQRLEKENFISPMSLIRKEAFTGFDEELRMYEDWDFWLTLVKAGARGVWVPEAIYDSHHIDAGLMQTEDPVSHCLRIREKHGIAH